MTIPAKGTTSRQIMDFIASAKTRKRNAVCRAINTVNKHVVLTLIDTEIKNGNLKENLAGLSWTVSAKAEAHAEREQVASVQFIQQPISAKNIPSSLGMREGSNDHLSWSSRHV